MTVQQALDNILHAILGRDVRQSIYDGIDTINKESKADMLEKQETIDNYTKQQNATIDNYKEEQQKTIEDYTKRQDGVISNYTGKMDLLNTKYEQQIKNMTLDSPSDVEIVDARMGADGKEYNTLRDRLDSTGIAVVFERKIIAGYTYQFEETIYLPSGFSATTCRLTSIRWKTKDVPVNYYWKVLAPGVNESPFSSLRVEINSGTVKVNGKIDSKYDRDAIVMELTFTKVAYFYADN